MASPLEQFTIVPIIDIEVADIDISFTNSSLWMAITAAVLVIFMIVSTQRRALVPGRMQASAEYFYQIIADMVRDNVGSQGRPYFPFIFSVFMFIMFGNLIGLIPGAFTFTSHLAVTFAMAGFIFVGVTIIGLVKHGFKFFSLFFPRCCKGFAGEFGSEEESNERAAHDHRHGKNDAHGEESRF